MCGHWKFCKEWENKQAEYFIGFGFYKLYLQCCFQVLWFRKHIFISRSSMNGWNETHVIKSFLPRYSDTSYTTITYYMYKVFVYKQYKTWQMEGYLLLQYFRWVKKIQQTRHTLQFRPVNSLVLLMLSFQYNVTGPRCS